MLLEAWDSKMGFHREEGVEGLRPRTLEQQLLGCLTSGSVGELLGIPSTRVFHVKRVHWGVGNIICITTVQRWPSNLTLEGTLEVSPSPSRNHRPPSRANLCLQTQKPSVQATAPLSGQWKSIYFKFPLDHSLVIKKDGRNSGESVSADSTIIEVGGFFRAREKLQLYATFRSRIGSQAMAS